jgi:hypothetical protein
MVLGELYVRGEEWKFRAVGQGWDSGLAGLAIAYGIAVENPDEDTVPTGIDGVDPPGIRFGATELHAVRLEGGSAGGDLDGADSVVAAAEERAELLEVPPSVDVQEVLTATASADLRSTAGTADSTPTSRTRPGVRTGKKRTTAASLPPMTLAVDPSWQPARLFSVPGVGNAEEQERRATSTLLSTMMVVGGFGRALVARFGGPAGSIET